MDGRTVGQRDGQTDRQTERHDQSNNIYSQFANGPCKSTYEYVSVFNQSSNVAIQTLGNVAELLPVGTAVK